MTWDLIWNELNVHKMKHTIQSLHDKTKLIDSDQFFSACIPSTIGTDKDFERITVITFLSINLNICFWCSKEPSD